MKEETKRDQRRRGDRVPMRADRPVFIEVNVDGNNVGVLVENLSCDGASLIYPEESPSIQPGSYLKECTLNLGAAGNIKVTPIVRWRVWPKLGVQFDKIGESSRSRIARFLQSK
jgi:c-di-GMP-binding flagellar brake protein YcgR